MRNKLFKKIDLWVNSNLITKEQAENIKTFENSNKYHISVNVFIIMAVVFGVLGLIYLTAYNWDLINIYVKLIVSLFILMGLALLINTFKHKSSWLIESLILAYSGVIIANMGLLAQVYQIDTIISYGIIWTWILLSIPALFFSKKFWLLAVMIPAVESSVFFILHDYLNKTSTDLYYVVCSIFAIIFLFLYFLIEQISKWHHSWKLLRTFGAPPLT